MEVLQDVLELGVFYNVSVVFILNQCRPPDSSHQPDSEDADILTEEEDDIFESSSEELSFLEQTKQFLGMSADIPGGASEEPSSVVQSSECVRLVSFNTGQTVTAATLTLWIAFATAALVSLVFICLLVRYFFKYLHDGERGSDILSTKQVTEEPDRPMLFESHENKCSSKNERENNESKNKSNIFNLQYFKLSTKFPCVQISRSLAKDFLAATVDKFLCEVDKSLGISSDSLLSQPVSLNPVLNTSSSSGAISSLVTPRLHRRSTWRRPRQGSPSLPLGDLSLMGDQNVPTTVCEWKEVENMNARLGWSLSLSEHFDFGNVEDRKLKDILKFHIRNCPISNSQMITTSMLVNYMLVLLEKELSLTKDESSLRFVEFKGFGSIAKGLKISKANQFNVAMIVQPTDCIIHNALHHDEVNEIPAGKILLSVKDLKQDRRQKPYTKRTSVIDIFGTYLLPREILVMSKELIDQALQRLIHSNKNLLDRFPFSIRTTLETDLQLVLDTRMLHGLGLGISEVCIKLCPAIPLLNSTVSLLPCLYAVPPWVVPEKKRQPSSSSSMRIFRERVEGLDPDLLWDLLFCELESSYLASMDRKLQMAGVIGCHRICLKVMKALFTSGYKTSLLSRGEIQSYQLETVLFFLLLESAPSNWSMEHLADRVSDCVHFLRSALQSMWLPSFFVHNPHLEKQMAVVKLYQLLGVGRQENLLANMKQETMEKVLNFLDQSLEEAGLKHCIKQDFSSDMWEYEFFIFG